MATTAAAHGPTRWWRVLASWYDRSTGDGSCGTLNDGRLHYAELGVAGDYGHGPASGRGNLAITLGLSEAQLPCGAGLWVRYHGKVTYATKADVGYGDTSLPPNDASQRRIDLYYNLADYLGFTGVGYVEVAPSFTAHPPLPGDYYDPLGKADVSAERIDQGVDYTAGTGYIAALARGKVTIATPDMPGWPGGMVAYQITQPGLLNGLTVYQAEGVDPAVHVGQVIAAGDRVADLRTGWHSGIEIGWANDPYSGVTYAREHGGWTTADDDASRVTASGLNFSEMLGGMGSAPGRIEGSLLPGSAPPGAVEFVKERGWAGTGVTFVTPPPPPRAAPASRLLAGVDPAADMRDMFYWLGTHAGRAEQNTRQALAEVMATTVIKPHKEGQL